MGSNGHQLPVVRFEDHFSAALGAGIAAIGRAVQMVPLDDEHLPRLHATLESVLAHAITAVARS